MKIRTLSDQRFLVGWTIISFVFSVLLTSMVAIFAYYAKRVGDLLPPPPSSTREAQEDPHPAVIPPWAVFGTDKLTFILLGYDEVDEFAHRSDTLMVGAVDFYARTVRVVSIPRDTLVYIPRRGFMKVNSAYALGGEELARETMEAFLGVETDYLISVNYRGFVEVVDALGGVDITVDRAMHYDDRRGDVHIHIEAGEHHFDGEEALDYARFRHDASGDLGRIERQQILLRALLDQAIRPAGWPRLRSAAEAFLKNIQVSANPDSPRGVPEVGFDQVVSIIGFLHQLDDGDARFYQVPVEDITFEGLSCLRPLYTGTRAMLTEVFAVDEPIAWRIDPDAPPPGTEVESPTDGTGPKSRTGSGEKGVL